jgi:hypothetical protein
MEKLNLDQLELVEMTENELQENEGGTDILALCLGTAAYIYSCALTGFSWGYEAAKKDFAKK